MSGSALRGAADAVDRDDNPFRNLSGRFDATLNRFCRGELKIVRPARALAAVCRSAATTSAARHIKFQAEVKAQTTAGWIAIMFTDLKGSTELYEALGDVTAYNLVRDHFALAEHAYFPVRQQTNPRLRMEGQFDIAAEIALVFDVAEGAMRAFRSFVKLVHAGLRAAAGRA